ncbi:MAG: adk, adenylate kinase, adenylate kinase [Candidatus Nomurabacteria bacterium]|nr:adk, adenylate kinase, adenylate kinase [Candidatus Nomurabacteria bacterium]
MHPVYLFIGQSGSGKDTQIALLQQKLLSIDPTMQSFYLKTGDKFRAFIEKQGFTSNRTSKMMAEGKLPPAFLAVHMWAQELIEHYDGTTTVFIDGTPRVPAEVPLLLSAAEFYGWTIDVINLQVSDEWANDRLRGRGRTDDTTAQTWGRIQWFHESVQPAIDLLRESPLVRFHDIHGEQTVEQVHKDVCEALGVA